MIKEEKNAACVMKSLFKKIPLSPLFFPGLSLEVVHGHTCVRVCAQGRSVSVTAGGLESWLLRPYLPIH